jgi:hypothetical protein
MIVYVNVLQVEWGRIINCLSGFSDLVKFEIENESQIGNIIVLIKKQLANTNDYSVEKHKELVTKRIN